MLQIFEDPILISGPIMYLSRKQNHFNYSILLFYFRTIMPRRQTKIDPICKARKATEANEDPAGFEKNYLDVKIGILFSRNPFNGIYFFLHLRHF